MQNLKFNSNNNGPVWCMKRQPGDGKIIIGGGFTTYGLLNTSVLNVTRIFPAPTTNEAKFSINYYDSEKDVELISDSDIVYYPNPAKNVLYFKSNLPLQNGIITLYNSIGQKVFEKSLIDTDDKIDITNINCGIYCISLKKQETTIVKHIVIK